MARHPVSEPAPEPDRKPRGPGRLAPHTLVQSFRWAWDGLGGAAVRERNMRIHVALGVLASAAASMLPVGGAERALLLLAVALVVAGEAANSALEAVVDLVSPSWNARARVAKDAAAGAVLALACGSVVVLLAVALPAIPALRDRGAALAPGAAGALAASAAAGAVALPAIPALRDRGAALAPGAAGALAASAAAGFLPAPGRRPAVIDVLLFAVGAVGIGAVARSADAIAGVAAAALLLLLAGGSAVRRRRGIDRG
jgi:diacylglycerol kinase (ATP)